MLKSRLKKIRIRKTKKNYRHRGGIYKKGELPIFTSEYKDIIKVCPSNLKNDKYCKYIVPRNLLPDTVGKSLFNKNRWEDIVQAVDTKSTLNEYNDVAADIGFGQLTRERAGAEGPATLLSEEGEGAALIGVRESIKRGEKKNIEWNPLMPEPDTGITNPGFAPTTPQALITGQVPKRINLPIKKKEGEEGEEEEEYPQFSNPNFQPNGGKGKHKTRKNLKKKKNLKLSKKSRKYRK